jgi:hypothetical protein
MVQHLQNELKQKDEQMQQLQAQLRQLDAQREAEVRQLEAQREAEASALAERMVETSLMSDGTHGTPRGSAAREDAANRLRIASSSVTRQLFTQPVADDVPPNSARGIARHGSEPIQGAPHGHGQMHGSRIASTIPPRPSPRGAVQPQSTQATPLQPWRSLSQGPVGAQVGNGTASPRCVKASVSSTHGNDHRVPAQVRTLVSEIERRSTSQTPGPISRMAEPSPAPHRGAHLLAGATVRAASATVGTSRTTNLPVTTSVTRAEPSRGRHVETDGSDHPLGSPKGSEESQQVVFGMSPMGRPRGDRKPLLTGVTTPSPTTTKGPSIHDRIRALYGH